MTIAIHDAAQGHAGHSEFMTWDPQLTCMRLLSNDLTKPVIILVDCDPET